MKNNKIILLIIVTLFAASCKIVLKKIYGIRKPRTETEASLKKYLTRKGLTTDNLYTVNAEDFTTLMSEKLGGIPEILIFDKQGRSIIYQEKLPENSKACNAGAFGFLSALNAETPLQYDSTFSLQKFLPMLKDFKGNPNPPKLSSEANFYLFIFWTRYIGRLNKDHVKVWEELAKNNSSVRIQTFKVNLDEQEWWK